MTASDDFVCVARVLDERHTADRDEIDALVDRSVAMRDLYDEQLVELRSVVSAGAAELDEPPRWVYYPWRAAAVRILGPRGYRRLRLDRNRNKITADEQDRFANLRLGVIGAGVGYTVAVGLALEGLFGTLRIADCDSLELSNLNRIPDSVLDYGMNKTVAAARRIAEIDPYLVVEQMSADLGVEDMGAFLGGLDLVVEVCDSLDMKLVLREHAAQRAIPVIMVSSDRGTVDVERFDTDPSRSPIHGLIDGVTSQTVAGLSSTQKVPYVLSMMGSDGFSARMAASMLEVGHTLTTWPHLAGDVLQAAAAAVLAVRRFGSVGELSSGRLHLDMARRLDELADPPAVVGLPESAPLGAYRNLPEPDSHHGAIARAAQLAPSGGNCQPWRIVSGPDTVHLELDAARTTTMDIGYRACYVAIGAALLNMRIAAARFGLLGSHELLPDGPAETGAAVARLALGSRYDSELASLWQPMLERVTNRNASEAGRTIGGADLAALTTAAAREGGELTIVTGRDTIGELAGLLADAERIRFLQPELHREMMAELRDPRRQDSDRGLDLRTMELGRGTVMLDLVARPDVVAELASWDAFAGTTVDSTTTIGKALGQRVGVLVESSSALAAVTVRGDGARDYLRGGAAMQRVWIVATAAGLAVQPIVPLYTYTRDDHELAKISGPYTERLVAARQRLRELFGVEEEDAFAMVFRIGYAPQPSVISRRSVDTLLVEGGDAARRNGRVPITSE